ncbi:MAG: ECF-type sigma factor, partial [Gemmataceae bacterium]
MADNSVTGWVQGMRAGDADAARRLWERYFGDMVRLACARLPRHAKRAFDEEDVALSAFQSFCAGVEAGRFPELSAREDLWRLLVVLTARKAQAYQRHATRQKRGGGKVVGEADLGADAPGFEAILGTAPTPAFLAEVAEQFRRLLEGLPDDEARKVALLKMEGYTVAEVAAGLGLSPRSVERRLQAIRDAWGSAP